MDLLTSRQLSEWFAYDRLDPIGEWRNDSRIALVCSVITNLFRSIWAKKGSHMTKTSDFMPDWNEEKKEKPKQSIDEMKAVLNRAFGFNKEK